MTTLALGGWLLHHMALFTPDSRYGLYLTAVRAHPLAPTLGLLGAGVACAALLRMRRAPEALVWAPLIIVVGLDLAWFGGGFNTSVNPSIARATTDLTRELAAYPRDMQVFRTAYPPTRQVAFLQSQPGPFRIFGGDYDALAPNLASAFGLEDVRGYHSLYTERYNRLARMIDGKDHSRTSAGVTSLRPYMTSAYEHRRLLDMLNAQYFVFPPDSRTFDLYPNLELVHESDEGRIYRNRQALPRAWVVYRVEVVPDDEGQLARMARADFDPAEVAVVAAAPAPLTAPENPGSAQVIARPNRLLIRASTPAPALLVISETYYDGWEAQVNGRPAAVERVNYALRGVWLPAGEHTVELVFRPLPMLAGGALSFATALSLALLWAWRLRPALLLHERPIGAQDYSSERNG